MHPTEMHKTPGQIVVYGYGNVVSGAKSNKSSEFGNVHRCHVTLTFFGHLA